MKQSSRPRLRSEAPLGGGAAAQIPDFEIGEALARRGFPSDVILDARMLLASPASSLASAASEVPGPRRAVPNAAFGAPSAHHRQDLAAQDGLLRLKQSGRAVRLRRNFHWWLTSAKRRFAEAPTTAPKRL